MTLSTTTTTAHRAFATHTPKWQSFASSFALASSTSLADNNTTQNVYSRQYSHVFSHRLQQLKARCWKAVATDSSDSTTIRVNRVLDLVEDENKLVTVVGTLVKEAGSGDKVDSTNDNDDKTTTTNCRVDDVLLLEDESGRVTLELDNDLSVHNYCTGVVVAVQGRVDTGGVLNVQRIYAPAPLEPATPVSMDTTTSDDNNNDDKDTPAPHVLLLSGLECGNPNTSSLSRDLLLSYLEGHFASSAANKVCRVVIAGGSVVADNDNISEGVKELDVLLAQLLAAGIPVDLVPGATDPTTHNWPQRPLHSSLFKYAGSFDENNLLHRTPNPYACTLGNDNNKTCLIMGTDGRNVADLRDTQLYNLEEQRRYSEIECLRKTLEWCHMCPSGPDSVPTVPHKEQDPFCMTALPKLYFCGNCTKFDTATLTDNGTCRLVCLPKFGMTGQAVMVNLHDLNVEVLQFVDE